MALPDILGQDHMHAAAKLLGTYYRRTAAGLPAYTGSMYSSWGGGAAARDVNRVTAEDLIAVSFLSVDVPGEAAFGILEPQAALISDLLAQIPADLEMAGLPPDDFDKVLGEASPARQLWHVLRGRGTGRRGMCETRTSKLMARKRPLLVPVYDSVAGHLMRLGPGSAGQWQKWHTALTDGTGLPERLQEIRRVSRITDPISDLRVMDIVLWMYGTGAATGERQ
ncbi:DUF6308 family protein [Pseudarthrobacter sulfonivorans]|uniref:DUF6308 family protein n=1 Tax=Pseudarthrobacter sulfonivorans TaxID=121292 RepID=UPI0021075BCD|nr:DUF6308 family protein [Pseudarthrobacter sulfonivorans]